MADQPNPYAPPEARTADPAVPSPDESRPRDVDVARFLIIASIVIAFTRTMLSPPPANNVLPQGFLIMGACVSALIWALLAYKIHDGRHWARVVVIVLAALGMAGWLFPAYRGLMMKISTIRLVLVIVNSCILAATSLLLLSPASNRWFRELKLSRA